jgi:hypothetical protein
MAQQIKLITCWNCETQYDSYETDECPTCLETEENNPHKEKSEIIKEVYSQENE